MNEDNAPSMENQALGYATVTLLKLSGLKATVDRTDTTSPVPPKVVIWCQQNGAKKRFNRNLRDSLRNLVTNGSNSNLVRLHSCHMTEETMDDEGNVISWSSVWPDDECSFGIPIPTAPSNSKTKHAITLNVGVKPHQGKVQQLGYAHLTAQIPEPDWTATVGDSHPLLEMEHISLPLETFKRSSFGLGARLGLGSKHIRSGYSISPSTVLKLQLQMTWEKANTACSNGSKETSRTLKLLSRFDTSASPLPFLRDFSQDSPLSNESVESADISGHCIDAAVGSIKIYPTSNASRTGGLSLEGSKTVKAANIAIQCDASELTIETEASLMDGSIVNLQAFPGTTIDVESKELRPDLPDTSSHSGEDNSQSPHFIPTTDGDLQVSLEGDGPTDSDPNDVEPKENDDLNESQSIPSRTYASVARISSMEKSTTNGQLVPRNSPPTTSPKIYAVIDLKESSSDLSETTMGTFDPVAPSEAHMQSGCGKWVQTNVMSCLEATNCSFFGEVVGEVVEGMVEGLNDITTCEVFDNETITCYDDMTCRTGCTTLDTCESTLVSYGKTLDRRTSLVDSLVDGDDSTLVLDLENPAETAEVARYLMRGNGTQRKIPSSMLAWASGRTARRARREPRTDQTDNIQEEPEKIIDAELADAPSISSEAGVINSSTSVFSM